MADRSGFYGTGARVEDDFDPMVSKLFWREYLLYSGLYFSFSFFLYRLPTKSGQTFMCTTLSLLRDSSSALEGISLTLLAVMMMVLLVVVSHRPQPQLLPLLYRFLQAKHDVVTVNETWRPTRSQVEKRQERDQHRSSLVSFTARCGRRRWQRKRVARERQNFELKLHWERQEAEDRRERECREYKEGRAREQREHEEKREAERAKAQAEVRQSEKDFNAALLAKLFDKK